MAKHLIKQVIDIGNGYVAHYRGNSIYIYSNGQHKLVEDETTGLKPLQQADGGFGVGGSWFKNRWGFVSDIPPVVKEFKRTFLKRLQHDS